MEILLNYIITDNVCKYLINSYNKTKKKKKTILYNTLLFICFIFICILCRYTSNIMHLCNTICYELCALSCMYNSIIPYSQLLIVEYKNLII